VAPSSGLVVVLLETSTVLLSLTMVESDPVLMVPSTTSRLLLKELTSGVYGFLQPEKASTTSITSKLIEVLILKI
jgi:hypothetical protein